MMQLFAARLLAGPEHGRTIPLADIGRLETLQCSGVGCHQPTLRFVIRLLPQHAIDVRLEITMGLRER
jgi:hypothetical protein